MPGRVIIKKEINFLLLLKGMIYDRMEYYCYSPLGTGKKCFSHLDRTWLPREGGSYAGEAYHLSFLICFIGIAASVIFYSSSRSRMKNTSQE